MKKYFLTFLKTIFIFGIISLLLLGSFLYALKISIDRNTKYRPEIPMSKWESAGYELYITENTDIGIMLRREDNTVQIYDVAFRYYGRGISYMDVYEKGTLYKNGEFTEIAETLYSSEKVLEELTSSSLTCYEYGKFVANFYNNQNCDFPDVIKFELVETDIDIDIVYLLMQADDSSVR